MSESKIVIKEEPPTTSEFAALRALAGWESPEIRILQQSIDASLYWVSVFSNQTLIGTGRVIGDGAMYFYIQDVIVHPKHQKVGLGAVIMQSINKYIAATCPTGSTVGLLCAQGKEQFYEKFGFVARNGQKLGFGMCKFM